MLLTLIVLPFLTPDPFSLPLPLLSPPSLSFPPAWAPPQPAVSEEQLSSKLAARTGEVVEVKAGGGSSRRKSRRSGGAGSALDKFRGSSNNATASVNKRKVAAGERAARSLTLELSRLQSRRAT